MPLPKRLARLNQRVTNRLMRPLARRLPPLAIVQHTGRSSGRRYATPVLAFPRGDEIAIALTYGPDTDWVANVLARGGAGIVRRNHERRYQRPMLHDGPSALALVPTVMRPPLRLLRVTTVLTLTAQDGAEPPPDDGSGVRRS